MTRSAGKTSRDDLDAKLAAALKQARPVPPPSGSEPSDDDLLLYIEGKLPPDRQREMERQLASSPYSQSRAEVLAEALDETSEKPAPALERAVRMVFHLAGSALTFLRGDSAPVPQLATAVRSAAAATASSHECYEFVHKLAELDANVIVDRANDGAVDVRLKLTRTGAPVRDARVMLERDGRLYEALDLERDGSATFRGLDAAKYRIEVQRAGKSIGSVRLDFLA